MRYGYQSSKSIPARNGHWVDRSRPEWRKRILTPRRCSLAAGIGIFGGVFFLFAGLICVILHELIAGDTACNQIGTFVLISAIPMILVGSIFLDEIRGNDA
ncbi:MAG: hypothetical protein QM785_16305 [Pyrinomonadaceae bacterium]